MLLSRCDRCFNYNQLNVYIHIKEHNNQDFSKISLKQ